MKPFRTNNPGNNFQAPPDNTARYTQSFQTTLERHQPALHSTLPMQPSAAPAFMPSHYNVQIGTDYQKNATLFQNTAPEILNLPDQETSFFSLQDAPVFPLTETPLFNLPSSIYPETGDAYKQFPTEFNPQNSFFPADSGLQPALAPTQDYSFSSHIWPESVILNPDSDQFHDVPALMTEPDLFMDGFTYPESNVSHNTDGFLPDNLTDKGSPVRTEETQPKKFNPRNQLMIDPEKEATLITKSALADRIYKRKTIPDPEDPSKTITKASLSNRKYRRKEVLDPQDPNRMITIGELRTRKKQKQLIIDPDKPGQLTTAQTLAQRQVNRRNAIDPISNEITTVGAIKRRTQAGKLVADTQNNGQLVKKGTLQSRIYRQAMVEDPENPGTMISRHSKIGREKIPDPDNPEKMISRAALKSRNRRAKSSLVQDPERKGSMISAEALARRTYDRTLVPDPRNPDRLIPRSQAKSTLKSMR